MSLTQLCIQSLVRHKEYLQSVENVPFHLLKEFLERININHLQLIKLEKTNIQWIIDDDILWLEFLKHEFPTHVIDQYIVDRRTILRFYKNLISQQYDRDWTIRNYTNYQLRLKLQHLITRDKIMGKYKIPYRMLYEQYSKEMQLRQEQVTEKLRLATQRQNIERANRQIVTLNDVNAVAYLQKRPRYKANRINNAFTNNALSNPYSNNGNATPSNKTIRKPVERRAFGGTAGGPIPAKRALATDTKSLAIDDRTCKRAQMDSIYIQQPPVKSHAPLIQDNKHVKTPSQTVQPSTRPTRRRTREVSPFLKKSRSHRNHN